MVDKYPLDEYLKLEGKYIREIKGSLRDASKEVGVFIRSIPKDEFDRVQFVARRAVIQEILNGPFDNLAGIIRRAQIDGVLVAGDVLDSYGRKRLENWFETEFIDDMFNNEARLATQGVVSLMDRLGGSYRPLAPQVYATKSIAKGLVDRQINAGLAAGLTPEQLAYRLERLISPDFPGGPSYAALRTARTEINNAYHQGSIRRYKESGIVTSVNWETSGSHPEGDDCDVLKRNGPYDLDHVPKKPHPECLCFITPNVKDDDEFFADIMDDDYGPRTGPTKSMVLANALKNFGKKYYSFSQQYAANAINLDLSSTLQVSVGAANALPVNTRMLLATQLRSVIAQRKLVEDYSHRRGITGGPSPQIFVIKPSPPRGGPLVNGSWPERDIISWDDDFAVHVMPPSTSPTPGVLGAYNRLPDGKAKDIAMGRPTPFSMMPGPSFAGPRTNIRYIIMPIDEGGAFPPGYLAPKLTPAIIQKGTYADIYKFFGDVYKKQAMGKNGYTVELDDVTVLGANKVEVNLAFRDSNGVKVGRAVRVFTVSGSAIGVAHELLVIDEDHRGAGIGSAFSKYSEDWYRSSKFVGIEIHAGLEDGGYVWAVAGYTWDSGPLPIELMHRLDAYLKDDDQSGLISQYQRTRMEFLVSEWKQAVAGKYSKSFPAKSYADLAQPWEIAALPGGKELLRGTDWLGIKRLDDAPDGSLLTPIIPED